MTTGLTDRQRKFVDAYARCRRGTTAAIEAGFSPKSAASTASRLLTRPEIAAALARRIEPAPVPVAEPFRSPLEHLLAVMRDPEVRVSRRDRAAISALPYCHAKAGDVGKKATAQEAAKKASAGKFAPVEPPKLALVKPGSPDTNR